MLNTQKYLLDGKTFEDLSSELGIKVVRHDTLPLAIVNYDQLESPKTNPVVRECRGLVLNTNDYSLAAKSFNRFFNFGEVQDEMHLFNFDDFIVQTKHDGSLVLIFNFNGKWMANTRGSFGKFLMDHQEFTWEQAFCKTLKIDKLDDLDGKLNPKLTYVCEFCSPYNKVVRRYTEPVMYLLTAFEGEKEVHWNDIDHHDLFQQTERHEFKSVEQIQNFLNENSSTDPTFEGVVIRDCHGNRYKIKSSTYLALHRLGSTKESLFAPKNLVPFVLSGESDELLTYFNEVEGKYREIEAKVNEEYQKLENLWLNNWQIENQKDFALSIQKKTPFTGILFNMRKLHGKEQSLELLKKTWRNSEDLIVKILF